VPDSAEAVGTAGIEPADETAASGQQIARLRYDLAARRTIDLATGILMAREDIDADTALARLEQLTDQLPAESQEPGPVVRDR
jgi:ANTAR domain-containing protein